jgi:mRNA-degrading endonuclease YafQ of YafQ-DinJ toxin-antitoxin module
MMLLKSSPQFEKAYRKFIHRYPFYQRKIDETILLMEADVDSPLLHTHKLSGKLRGLSACSCGYDCRIIFSIEYDKKACKNFLLLIDIGTHDEVY